MKTRTPIYHRSFAFVNLLITAVMFYGCETRYVSVEPTLTKISGRMISVYVIDSCQYIGNVYGGHGDMIAHKGNCKFCAERNKNSCN
jgi:hypothetical protein